MLFTVCCYIITFMFIFGYGFMIYTSVRDDIRSERKRKEELRIQEAEDDPLNFDVF